MWEYRVRWQRIGLRKKVKIYQTIQGAEDYIKVLTDGPYSEYAEELEIPELIDDPIIEKRPVGIWSI